MHNNNFWLPFTPNRYFNKNQKLLQQAKGMYYTTPDGKKILDSCAGLWCVNAGHGQETIVKAIQSQAETLDYAPSFQVTHPMTIELSAKLCQLAPQGFSHAFFANSGSEAVDSVLKMALHYQQAKGEHQRTLLVGRQRDYHGVGFGGISVGGLPNNNKHFPMLPNVLHLPHTHHIEQNAFSQGQPTYSTPFQDDINILTGKEDQIAAIIVEPMAGSVGVYLPPEGYLQSLRKYCDEIGALLIFDEVITAFGRLGNSFAAHEFNVVPDLITLAKGLTNGTVPMGAVLAKSDIYDTIVNAANEKAIEFYHGYTYTGHPLACSAALASLEVYQEQDLFSRSKTLAPYWQDQVHNLKDCKNVIDIRNYGLVAAIELSPKAEQPGARAFEAFQMAFEAGILLRITGDTIALSPPLIIEKDQIDLLCNVLADIFNKLT